MSQIYSASATTLSSPAKITEEYIPLWFADGTTVHSNNTTLGTGGDALVDGGQVGVLTATGAKLFTLSSTWPSSTKFAFEVTMYTADTSCQVTAVLYDITISTNVSGSACQTSSTTATNVRSGQFTLTPGHVYGVNIQTSNASYYNYTIDASLVVFGS